MRSKLVVIGGGGHARVVLDVFNRCEVFDIVGYTSVQRDPTTEALFKIPRLGSDERLAALRDAGVGNAFIAIGDNRVRKSCFEAAVRLGFSMIPLVSPEAIVSTHATVREGAAIMPGAIVNAGAEIGRGAIINTNASIDHDCVIGEFAHVAPGAALAGGVSVGPGALLGVGARVLPNVAIGREAIAGAGAVVLRDLADGVTAVGVPAVVISGRRA